jgi:hypothetical protein
MPWPERSWGVGYRLFSCGLGSFAEYGNSRAQVLRLSATRNYRIEESYERGTWMRWNWQKLREL